MYLWYIKENGLWIKVLQAFETTRTKAQCHNRDTSTKYTDCSLPSPNCSGFASFLTNLY